MAIIAKLSAADPKDADRRHEVGVSHGKLGDVLAARHSLGDALVEYRAALEIATALAAADPASRDRKQDVSATTERVGDMLLAQRDAAGAVVEYRAGWWRPRSRRARPGTRRRPRARGAVSSRG